MENEESFEEKLKAWLFSADRVAVVGVGNTMRRDDALGVEIVKRLRGKVSQRVSLVEAETMPENYIDPLLEFRPSHVLIIDSGLMGKRPGSARLQKPNENVKTPISTHTLQLEVFCVYLEKAIRAKILLLIIQPKDTSVGEGVTKEIAKAEERISDLLIEILPKA
jgi:hydrogenase maturation protease HycI